LLTTEHDVATLRVGQLNRCCAGYTAELLCYSLLDEAQLNGALYRGPLILGLYSTQTPLAIHNMRQTARLHVNVSAVVQSKFTGAL